MVEKNRIRDILKRISKKKILVIGDIIADEYIYGHTYRLSREAPIPIVRFQSSEIRPGGAGNVAVNISAMGGEAIVAGVVGDDAYAKEIINIFRRHSVSPDAVVINRGPSIIKTRVLAGDVNSSMQQIFRLDRGINCAYPQRLYRSLKEEIIRHLSRCDAVVLSDYGEGLFAEGFIKWVLKVIKNKPVIADSRFNIKRYKRITALTPNLNELSMFFGRFIQKDSDFEQALKRLKRFTGARYILLKRGRSGITVMGEDGSIESFSAFGNTEVADVTGAGDTVLAAFSLALASGIGVIEAARFANIAGGIKVQKRGTVPVSREDILRAVNGRKV